MVLDLELLLPRNNGQPCYANPRPQGQEVNFRTVPRMEEVFPRSTKEYTEVVHQPTGEKLQVRPGSTWVLCERTTAIAICGLHN